ncbi:MAG TPA: carbohydrate ABC transporter permease [Firmicutes bacterium]|nr:carbohydrate ABC transporter permease [Bacillota bacterium]
MAVSKQSRQYLRAARWIQERGIVYLALIAMGIIFILPFFWLVSTSLKPDDQLFKFPPIWIPKPIMWGNYPRALTYIPFWLYLKNTLIIAIPSTLGLLISSSVVAYGFSRIKWPGRDAVFFLAICTMMLPYQVTMIPLFIVFRNLGWVGTFKPLIIPSFFGGAFYIFLLRQFYMTLPMELSDAARIDGCSEFGIYSRIILPLSKPALATVGLFSFMGHWNDFLAPLIYLEDDTKYTLALGLQQFQRQFGMEWGMLMAMSVVISLPIIVLFFFTQRTFVQGIALTGMKG